jgi:hypothetical protein
VLRWHAAAAFHQQPCLNARRSAAATFRPQLGSNVPGLRPHAREALARRWRRDRCLCPMGLLPHARAAFARREYRGLCLYPVGLLPNALCRRDLGNRTSTMRRASTALLRC